MKKLLLLAAVMLGIAAMMAGSASGASDPRQAALADLSNQADLGTTTTVATADGTATTTAYLDTVATTAILGADGYLCGTVQYRAIEKAYDFWGFVVWTYRETFGVHVCHNHVGYKTALYDEPMDSNFGWTWCGNVAKQFTNQTSSAIGYTKGCFTVAYKIVQTKYPWASMTIGGNGHLWARKTGGA